MDSLVKALKTANQQQIDLINKLIADCAEYERRIKFLLDFIKAQGLVVPKLN